MSDAYFDQENRIEQALEDLANGDFPNATKAALWYDVDPCSCLGSVPSSPGYNPLPANFSLCPDLRVVLDRALFFHHYLSSFLSPSEALSRPETGSCDKILARLQEQAWEELPRHAAHARTVR